MKAHTAMIVTHDQGTITVKIEDLHAAAEVRGWRVVGNKMQRGSIALREEITGQPIFDKLCGPMYGGEGIVRYETGPVNDLHST